MDQPWRETFLRGVRAGLPVKDAAARSGVSIWVAAQAQRDDPAFAAAVSRARAAVRQQRVDALLAALADGHPLTEAADLAGIAIPTLKRWRRQDLDLDSHVLAAAIQGGQRLGGRTQMRPTNRLVCPGPKCGTPTGYEYGCRGDACTSAKTAPILQKRKELRDGKQT